MRIMMTTAGYVGEQDSHWKEEVALNTKKHILIGGVTDRLGEGCCGLLEPERSQGSVDRIVDVVTAKLGAVHPLHTPPMQKMDIGRHKQRLLYAYIYIDWVRVRVRVTVTVRVTVKVRVTFKVRVKFGVYV